MVLDPASGRNLPDDTIQRVLFVTNNVHVYQIPPLTSTKGFSASSWTSPTQPTAREIFTARLRVIETAANGRLTAAIVLEDANSGDLFAAAPYTSTAVVQPALDSSRFFAVRVQGDGGMKATLGIGFEDRSPAFDFGIALTEVQKVLEFGGATSSQLKTSGTGKLEALAKQDFSLKEGQKIQIQLGPNARRQATISASTPGDDDALFSIAPPPSANKTTSNKNAQELGFDDGEFGEFQ